MKLYLRRGYTRKKIKAIDKNIVDILTSDERSSIRQGHYDNLFERQDTTSFAINYAWRRGDRSPILRGFEFGGKLYEIYFKKKILLIQQPFGQLFYDEDKIEKNDFVFEGKPDEFITEFIKKGYQIKASN